MGKLLEVENLTLSYGKGNDKRVILNNISFSVERGQIFGIVGLSGAGKTSLLRTFNLLNVPDSGRIIFDGVEITSLNEKELRKIRRRIGIVFQSFNLFRSKTVLENIAFPLTLETCDKKTVFERAKNIARELGLSHRLEAYPSQLSGGEQQRVSIARALITDPKLILLDEPTSALDPLTTKKMLNLVLEINQRHNVAIVVVTHDMDVVKKICDFVIFLKGGRINFRGPAHEFFVKIENGEIEEFGERMEEEVFPELMQELNDKRIFRIIFLGEGTKEPILWETSKGLDVRINILYGKIEKLKFRNYGSLIIGVDGKDVDDFIERLRPKVCSVKELTDQNQREVNDVRRSL